MNKIALFLFLILIESQANASRMTTGVSHVVGPVIERESKMGAPKRWVQGQIEKGKIQKDRRIDPMGQIQTVLNPEQIEKYKNAGVIDAQTTSSHPMGYVDSSVYKDAEDRYQSAIASNKKFVVYETDSHGKRLQIQVSPQVAKLRENKNKWGRRAKVTGAVSAATAPLSFIPFAGVVPAVISVGSGVIAVGAGVTGYVHSNIMKKKIQQNMRERTEGFRRLYAEGAKATDHINLIDKIISQRLKSTTSEFEIEAKHLANSRMRATTILRQTEIDTNKAKLLQEKEEVKRLPNNKTKIARLAKIESDIDVEGTRSILLTDSEAEIILLEERMRLMRPSVEAEVAKYEKVSREDLLAELLFTKASQMRLDAVAAYFKTKNQMFAGKFRELTGIVTTSERGRGRSQSSITRSSVTEDTRRSTEKSRYSLTRQDSSGSGTTSP